MAKTEKGHGSSVNEGITNGSKIATLRCSLPTKGTIMYFFSDNQWRSKGWDHAPRT